ncbi:hypothetical protein J27TS8_14140 [Robertmurraya siralis]|uniref:DUF3397 domain-containing protein n=1 Tax=Robertmurraya siralis TaxID=77777 RepID=A0A919WG87_9BACI|nr:DUF3397 domain-containing protein [Robertmurraya siralis]PAE19224.1 hypothetical protein CHH80_17650 [Bacillus sp. 7504-2]GIN61421.1 hypothetical protein J27TS8_14140 [Robertmurraya siralis]
MSNVFSNVAAALITIPILGYIIIFVICKQATKQHRRAVQMALDGSTLLFIISVHYMIMTIWNKSLLWLILILILLIGAAVVLLHWKIKQEIDYHKVFKGFWRFNFLVFFSAYIILLIIGIVRSISHAVS